MKSRLQVWLRRAFATQETLVADDLLSESLLTGATAIRDVQAGERVRLHGVVKSVTLRPREALRALEVELFDGSASIDLIWLGRRSIAGVHAGSVLDVTGRVVRHHGRLALFNPRYSLRPRQEAS